MIAAENAHVRVLLPASDAGEPGAIPQDSPNGVVLIDLDDGSARYVSGSGATAGPREVSVELRDAPVVQPHPLSAVEVDPDRYKIVLENDKVRVVRLGFAPGERGVMVNHPPRVLVTLTDVHVQLLFEDGRTDEVTAPAGVAAWMEAATLQTENAGDTALEVVLVEPVSSVEREA
jgi:hypothetical protein